jgi:putative photosynthetic complex assembly protein
MSHAAHHDPVVPRGALIGAGAMLAFVLALTGAVSAGLLPREGDPVASRAAANVAAESERALIFADRSDGAVVVSDAETGTEVAVVDFGQGGFLRATMRRLAKARAAKGVGASPPFILTRWDNGALSLRDPQTGRQAELHGFGADHSRLFANMLEARHQ